MAHAALYLTSRESSFVTGIVLAVDGVFRDVREKLFGGPREARLSQPALDVLACRPRTRRPS